MAEKICVQMSLWSEDNSETVVLIKIYEMLL